MENISRRSLLSVGLGAGIVAAMPGAAVAVSTADDTGLKTDPFMLGIASGEPWADGFVLWTRLALNPLAEDGLGGMPNRSIPVAWEVAEDEGMRKVVARGIEQARVETGHSIHVELKGLKSGREYFYRFRAGRYVTAVGRTMTSPALHETPAALAMAFASCSQFEHGYFTAYRHLAEDHPDLVLHLGDYIYEYKKDSYVIGGGNPRDHEGPETTTLAGYRQRHAQYKSDADLQAAHAVAPWLVVWDDHEVDNNWADEVPENQDPNQLNDTTENFRKRRAAAFQAYYENMPLRASSVPAGFDMKIYRTLQWGQLANFHMMDTRQYRDDQAAGDGWKKNVAERLDENRSITGADQERWLLDGFKNSTQRWDILGQQVFFTERDRAQDPAIDDVSMDGWDGYAASRRRITQGWVDANVRNAVVLTGDVHRNWAADVKIDYKDPESPVVGSELVCTSITSTGNGSGATVDPVMAWNPHLKFYNDNRGYVNTRITKDAMQADFRVLDYVTTPGAPVSTKVSYEILDGVRGLQAKV
ncbi:alkaline phosphatase D family protein [Pseudarthrobacter sp. J75]|uniref:alkaline phosphatase D family protein n=1 Tax=unclassified Pseudarthrobacter TaxID=2647000 RepID=UPI002E823BC2|nr:MULTISPECIES: alkaline phosphatase D family protein [unclassified Pseudarthrobacter]MEE2524568.1 alkaline phosphatase D family protein [Pseudarthrobacter sp. J47]MEE2527603.1 alkaline phosphatase D family protein [Pseudarthrobacter sp. J75]